MPLCGSRHTYQTFIGRSTPLRDQTAEGGIVSARDARPGSARDRTTGKGRRQSSSSRADRERSANVRSSARRAPGGKGGRTTADAPVPGEGLVIGPVPVLARVAGLLLALAGVLGVAAVFPTYLTVDGTELTQATGLGGVLAGVLVPLTHVAVGAVLLRGAVPKFGLAYAGVAAALGLGQLLIEIYRGSTSTDRPGVEVLAGVKVLTSDIETGPGWVLGLAAIGLTVIAGIVAAVAWGRTVMDDGGSFDPARPGVAGTATLLGVLSVLSLSLPAADVPDEIVTDPVTGLQTVVTQEGPQALLERPGLALMGGLLLAGALVLCSVIAPSLRPRLAAVGGLLAITVTVLAAAITGLRDAASPDLQWTLPGAGLLLAGIGYGVLTVLAWRLRRQ
jgi:hypothetical protein